MRPALVLLALSLAACSAHEPAPTDANGAVAVRTGEQGAQTNTHDPDITPAQPGETGTGRQ